MSTDDVGRPYGLADRLDELLLRIDLWRDRPPVVAGLVVAGVVLAAVAWWFGRPPPGPAIEELIPLARTTSTTTLTEASPVGEVAPRDEAPSADLVVHVAGAVAEPGLVAVPAGSRVDDAIAAAGGPTADADVHRLNLAASVVDGMQIRVPPVGEDGGPALVVLPEPSSGSGSGAPAPPVDVNRATGEQLQTLPGVGPATAAAIIAWRSENGPFGSADELTLVPGIGPAKLATIRDLITV